MITGVHALIYSSNAGVVRGFLRDMFGFSYVEDSEGWYIFALPPAELSIHPTDGAGQHELYLMCDDIVATMDELAALGVEFSKPVTSERWGRRTAIKLPDGGELSLYEPSHPTIADPGHHRPLPGG